MTTIGERLKKLRGKTGKSIRETAPYLGVSHTTLSRYENDSREPTTAFINKASEYYNVSTDYLLCKSDIKEDPHYKIKSAIEEKPELLDFWNELVKRDDLQLLFKQTKSLDSEAIRSIIEVIKLIEDNHKN